MKKLIIVVSVLLLALLVAASFIYIQIHPHFSWIDFFIGKVDVLRADKKTEPAEVKMKVYLNDAVKTYRQSAAFLQFGADNIIQVNENTEFSLATLPEANASSESATALDLIKGGISAWVDKLSKDGSFRIKTPTLKIAVRGTMFHITDRDGKTSVLVKEGSVTVTSNNNEFPEFHVESGKKAEISGNKIKHSKMKEEDHAVFKQIKELRPVAGINCTPPEYLEKYFRWRLAMAPAAPKKDDRKETKKEKTKESINATKDVKESKSDDGVRFRLGISTLVANGVEEATAAGIGDSLYTNLVAIKGADRVVNRAKGDTRSINRTLTGRVSALGKTRILALNVIDSENGKVIANMTETISEGDSLDAKVQDLARKIGGVRSIWE